MEKNPGLYFVAIVPPEKIQSELTHIKLHFKNNFNSQHALKSPPHITLIPPFRFNSDEESILAQSLDKYCKTRSFFEQNLSGFGAFHPKVIYVGVVKNNELSKLQSQLSVSFRSMLNLKEKQKREYPFFPHLTVAFRDLTVENFKIAWKLYSHKKIDYKFNVEDICLLKHDGKIWEIIHKGNFKS